MNSKSRLQVIKWADTHLIPSDRVSAKQYYTLRIKSNHFKHNLVGNLTEHIYVSKRGRVYTKISDTLWKELNYSVTIHFNGIKPKYYVYVTIKSRHYSLSRLVATVWVIKSCEDYNVVMHLDDDRLNNKYTNLQWGTQQQNIRMSVSRGHFSKPHRDRKLTRDQEDKLLEEIRSGKFSQRYLAKKWGFKSQGAIQRIIKRNRK